MIPAWCPDPLEPCCDCLYNTVDALVVAAADAVLACLPTELCDTFYRQVSIGPPVGPGDYMAGWIDTIVPAPSRQAQPGAKQVLAPRLIANIGLRLVEGGYPTLRNVGGQIALPDRDKLSYVSLHFYGHAEAATRALLNALTPACSRGCESIRFVSSQPAQPQTTSLTWNWALQATLKW